MSIQDSMLNRLAKATADATRSEVVLVLMANRQDTALKIVGEHNSKSNGLFGVNFPLADNDFLGEAALNGSEAALNDLTKLPTPIGALMESHGVQTVLAIPIAGSTGSFGIMLLGGRKDFGKSVIPIARALGSLSTLCYERDHLLSELTQETNELQWLASITDKIRLEEGRDKVVSAVIEAGGEVLEADAIALYLLDDGNESLTCIISQGLPVSMVNAKSARQQAALLDTLDLQDPLVISDIQELPVEAPFRHFVLDVNIRSMLGLQLNHRGQPMGILIAFYKRPGAAAERRTELCRMLALDAAVALNYSRLLEQSRALVRDLEDANVRLEQQAIQDGLTGLANHRAFYQRLAEHVHRVGRYGETFSVAMIDVDHFKAYNDAYGHQQGDFALQRIAAIISHELRESDYAARYGGEEFAIIIPHTSKSLARIALERIRKAIDTYQFPDGKLTISGGIAECPIDGVTANEVLEKADRALYHSKLTGRNRVCLWAAASDDNQLRAESSQNAKSVSVLVVECDLIARRALETALERSGYEMHKASSTMEAMELLRSRKFDIMLSDTLILGTEGMQVLGLASSIHPTMPIVLTAMPDMATAARDAMQHGVTDLLVKPFSEHELPIVIERNLERKRIERQMLLEKSTGILLQAIDALVAAIDARDRLTAGHTTRVTHLALAISDTLGLPSEERYTLELAARLHDIGKLSLPDSSLNKPGALSNEEWEAMQRHPSVGSQIVGSIEELSYIATIVRHHHERLDGKGYPDGLQGDAIPFLSRIIAVADAFEAMTSERAYRPRLSFTDAIAELRRCVGTHYSSEIVEALIENLTADNNSDHQQKEAA